MSTEDNKAIVRRFVDEVLNKHDSGAIDQLFAADLVNHTPNQESLPHAMGSKDFSARFFQRFLICKPP